MIYLLELLPIPPTYLHGWTAIGIYIIFIESKQNSIFFNKFRAGNISLKGRIANLPRLLSVQYC
jgi:hypothetical protein